MLNYHDKTVEQLWDSFKTAINQGISKYIPIKRFGVKKSLPWITQEIKRLIRKRDKLFHTQKKPGKNFDRHHFKQVKYLVQTKIRSAYDIYLQNILGLSAQTADGSSSGFIPKKLYSLIKNARQDSQGISPLLDKQQNILITSTKGQAKSLKSAVSICFFTFISLASCVWKIFRNFLKMYQKTLNANILKCLKLKLT